MAGLSRNLVRRCFGLHQLCVRSAPCITSMNLPKDFTSNRLKDTYCIQFTATRHFHQTVVLTKKQKFDPAMYEKVYVFDPSGHFLMECEHLVLKKFCHRIHRFQCEKLESAELSEFATKHNLKTDQDFFQIKEKFSLEDKEDEHEKNVKTYHAKQKVEKHVKIVRANMKDQVQEFQIEKVIDELFNHGSVALRYKPVRVS